MTRIRCKDEIGELQAALENNLDLIPGDQISPDDPRKWLLVKREMPVPDPDTSSDAWSIDFLLGDQDAVPTFVECKRCDDTRARREVVGQILEYAANGHYYWTSESLRNYAQETLEKKGRKLDESIRALDPSADDLPEQYFDRMQDNLREGRLRLIFFLEEAPMSLRSIVDFLNRQMERSEVLLVEARLYQQGDLRIVSPSLFGYTEQARRAKRQITVSTAGPRRQLDETSFFTKLPSTFSGAERKSVKRLIDGVSTCGCEIVWNTASFSVKPLSFRRGSLVTVNTNGMIILNFGSLGNDSSADKLRVRMRVLAVKRLGFEIPEDKARKWPSFKMSEWAPKVEQLVTMISELVTEYEESEA